jgi:nicotinamide-nucleotide amidase
MASLRPLRTAALLSVGSELLVGETRDTNSGDLARELAGRGVEVVRTTALPDRLKVVADAFRQGLDVADVVVSTGGLGPTPDDLTREAIAAVCDQQPFVDAELERWLRGLFERRGLTFSSANLKQAWLIDGATSLPNPNGTAPGWWVDRPDGRVVVALPGPPREMAPMWRDAVLPRLEARGLGDDRVAETLRLTGIGESMLVDLIGEDVLRRRNPEVATYARSDAVDVRVSAVAEDGRAARELVDAAVAGLLPTLGRYVFARGDQTWADALLARLDGRTLATVEIGTAGQLATLVGGMRPLLLAEILASASPPAARHDEIGPHAASVRERAAADVGLAVRAVERDGDMQVDIGVAMGDTVTQETRTAFLGGEMGRRRAALLACAELWARLADPPLS